MAAGRARRWHRAVERVRNAVQTWMPSPLWEPGPHLGHKASRATGLSEALEEASPERADDPDDDLVHRSTTRLLARRIAVADPGH